MDFEELWQSFELRLAINDNHVAYWTPTHREEYMTAVAIQGELDLEQLILSRVWEYPNLTAEQHASMLPFVAETKAQSWIRAAILASNQPRILAMVQAEMAIQQEAANLVQQFNEENEIMDDLMNELIIDPDEEIEEDPEEEPEMDPNEEPEEEQDMDPEEDPQEDSVEEMDLDDNLSGIESVGSNSSIG